MSQDAYSIQPIRTEADYHVALKQVEPYFDDEPDPDSDAGAHFEALITLIAAYEAKHFPVDPPDAVEAIKFRMEQQGLTARDLEPMIGSRGRVSEVLNRKRPLSMGIAAESLIRLHGAQLIGPVNDQVDIPRMRSRAEMSSGKPRLKNTT